MLMVGERPEGAAPSLTLACHLARLDCEAVFVPEHPRMSARAWIRLLRRMDAVLIQSYGIPPLSLMRRCAVALALGKPVIRRWAGSDVLACLESDEARSSSLALDRLGLLNVTPATWLAKSLATFGIQATVVPPIVDSDLQLIQPNPGPLPLFVLVYLPSNRREFYGERFVRHAVEHNRDLTFLVVADADHALAMHPNVESLGWVENMNDVWPRVGCVLRMTRHDGLPRMLVEGLARGRYAICSIPLDGCWLAKDSQQVQEHLERFRRERVSPNAAGIEAAHRMTKGEGARKVLDVIQSDLRKQNDFRRLNGLAMAAILTFRIAWERLVKGPRHDQDNADFI